jgi:GT2 family glycosyltransferase
LNPDVLLLPHFVRNLWQAGQCDPSAGTVCGKLLSIGAGFRPLDEHRLDSTGIFFTPAMRHFDRGWHEPDTAEFDSMEYVFGASAAAALYRREMIEDISIDGDFFDRDFFCYREDADVAWRAILQGWKCIYTPAAVSYHVRSVVPGSRRVVPRAINMHSVKNRFLMRLKNTSGALYRRYWLPMTARDLLVIGGAVFAEPSSLAAFWRLVRCLPRALRARQVIMSRRRIDDATLASWFSFDPMSMPMGERHELPAAHSGANPAVRADTATTSTI